MGALRKQSEVFQPTEIILLPFEEGRPDKPQKRVQSSWWANFKQTEAYSVAVFEVKAFAIVGLVATMALFIGGGGLFLKKSLGIDLNPEFSYTEFVDDASVAKFQ